MTRYVTLSTLIGLLLCIEVTDAVLTEPLEPLWLAHEFPSQSEWAVFQHTRLTRVPGPQDAGQHLKKRGSEREHCF